MLVRYKKREESCRGLSPVVAHSSLLLGTNLFSEKVLMEKLFLKLDLFLAFYPIFMFEDLLRFGLKY